LHLVRSEFAEAFECIEHAKSRSMAEALRVPGLASIPPEIDEIRRQLNWFYRRMELAELHPSGIDEHYLRFQRAARECEQEISRRLNTLGPGPGAALAGSPQISAGELRASLPAGVTLLEYFECDGSLLACVLDSGGLHIVPVARTADVLTRFRFLQFQLGKFQLGPDYHNRFGPSLHTVALAHLQRLHELLITPIRNRLANRHLVIVPHGFLHQLPFHALFDGRRYLIDEFTVSYAPSAAVYSACQSAKAAAQGPALVMGIPDRFAPQIDREARAVAGVMPGSRLLLGGEATEANLRALGPDSRLIHISTHGLFRRDNPLFSSIRLGDGHLSLVDLYRIRLSAELVTLSGCSTGLNAVVGGDELLGLVRGLLYAGARSALVSLWDVSDTSTTEFMTSFYPLMVAGRGPAEALRHAMLRVRAVRPHPYYWAPFVLVGNF
jgi:CHAT domain